MNYSALLYDEEAMGEFNPFDCLPIEIISFILLIAFPDPSDYLHSSLTCESFRRAVMGWRTSNIYPAREITSFIPHHFKLSYIGLSTDARIRIMTIIGSQFRKINSLPLYVKGLHIVGGDSSGRRLGHIIERKTSIREIKISDGQGCSSRLIRAVASNPLIVRIHLDTTLVNVATMKIISASTTLETLIMKYCDIDYLEIKELSRNKSIKHLSLVGNHLQNYESFALIIGIPTLVSLDVSYCKMMTNERAWCFKGTTNLTHIKADHNSLGDAFAFGLATNPNLTNIDMSYNNLTDRSVEAFKQIKDLQDLNVTGNRVTEEGLKGFAGIPHVLPRAK